MAANKYQGVILAAGGGSRMGPFGEELPKPIAPICNKPLMAYQLEHMQRLGIEDIVIVIGHLGQRIVDAIGDGSAYGVRVRYVEQKERLGLAHAVGQLEPHMDRPFMLMLGDIFFEVPDLHEMFDAFEVDDTAAVLAVRDDESEEAIKRNFTVLLGEDGRVRRVIEKPRRVSNRLKGCGLYFFDERIFEAVRRTPRTAMRDEYELTDSIQIMIDYEYPVQAVNVVEWDMNLTFVGDLITCSRKELARRGVESVVGEGCALDSGVTLVESVVGDGVTIANPIALERCVVLPGLTIDGSENISDAVITASGPLRGQDA